MRSAFGRLFRLREASLTRPDSVCWELLELTFVKCVGYKMRAMLRKLLRSALVVLLVGTVPIQALAALSIDVCNAVEHSSGHAPHADAGHGDPLLGDPIHHDQGPADETTHNHLASCGVAAAIVAPTKILPADAPSDGIQAASFRAPDGFVPDGLYRPPLTLSI